MPRPSKLPSLLPFERTPILMADRGVRVLQIRGTNGSGKSTTVRRLLAEWGPGTQEPDYWVATHPTLGTLAAIGQYPPRLNTGGCDTVTAPKTEAGNSMDEVCARVLRAVNAGHHVVFEGLIATSVHERFQRLQKYLSDAGHTYLTAFLQPPDEWCIRNVEARRRRQTAQRAEFNPKNLLAKSKLLTGHIRHWEASGLPFIMLPYEDPLAEVLAFFQLPSTSHRHLEDYLAALEQPAEEPAPQPAKAPKRPAHQQESLF